jgi:hypothetical protein
MPTALQVITAAIALGGTWVGYKVYNRFYRRMTPCQMRAYMDL